ncbi:hypothetical protein N6P31_09835 [Pectobacterium betavasculorum]|uniref:hypothetical protein n=1 Tax=Pectobacterium betavasculorum TaxID=55207 RepID=UPI00313D6422
MSSDAEDIDPQPQGEDKSLHLKAPRKAFSKLAVELTDDDLKSQGVQKLLLAEISRLETSETRADSFRDKFHEKDKQCSVLAEKSKTVVFSEILYSVSLTLGAALLGLTPSIKSDGIYPGVIFVIGVILIIGAVVAKVFRK